MAKILDLPALDEAQADGSELAPVVKGGVTYGARLDALGRITAAEARAAADDAQGIVDNFYGVGTHSRAVAGITDAAGNLAIAINDEGKTDFVPDSLLLDRFDVGLQIPVLRGNAGHPIYVNGLVDEAGNFALGIRRNARIDAKFGPVALDDIADHFGLRPRSIAAPSPSAVTVLDNAGADITIDAPGNISGAHRITPSLIRFLSDMDGTARFYVQRTDIESQTAMAEAPKRLEYLAHSGQSLSIGGNGNGAVHIDPPFPAYAFSFNTGTRGVQAGILDSATLTDFIPARETFNPGGSGETPGTGMMAWLHDAERKAGEKFSTYVYRTHGAGSASVAQLSKGTNPYANGLKEWTKAVEIAGIYGREAICREISWTQGTEDRRIGTTQAAYVAAMVQLLTDYRADWGSLNPGDAAPISMLIDQLAANAQSGAVTASPVALAQMQLAREHDGFYLVCPKYFLKPIDTLHLTPRASAKLGEYHARTRKALREGSEWAALGQWLTIARNGATITIDYFRDAAKTLPWSDLTFDTDSLPEAEAMGFLYSSSAISAVEVEGNRITLGLANAGGGELSFAYDGPGASGRFGAWGNLRAATPDLSRVEPDSPLFDWHAIIKETVA